jgi:hypothetical protein
MFYVNHNDMEDMFREAAENYQLSVDAATDWEKIDNAVHEKAAEKNQSHKNRKKDKYFIFWYLFFISISLFSYNIWNIESGKELLQKNTSSVNTSTVNKTKQSNHITAPIVNVDKLPIKKREGPDKAVLHKNKTVSAFNISSAIKGTNNKTGLLFRREENNNMENENSLENKSRNFYSIVPLLNQLKIFNDPKINSNKNLPYVINYENNNQVVNSYKSDNVSLKRSKSHFYAGLIAGPDLTFVRFQKTNGVGINFGLTAGYSLNNKWSIETGVLFDIKKYYTKGEYFNKRRVPDFSYVDLLSINGNCNMIEIPVNVQYKFASNKTHNWIIAFGSSSFLMTKEYYNYSAIANGENQQGEFTHYPSSSHLFATVNLSAGYETKLSNTLRLNIQPYFKVPIAGIGTGNLHMYSTGFNLEIVKSFPGTCH